MVNQTAIGLRDKQIYLGEHIYTITQSVTRQLVSQPPPLVRSGDVDLGTHPLASINAWDDMRGGIGVDVMEGEQDRNRCWFSNCSLRHKGHIVLQRLVTQTAAPGVGTLCKELIPFNNAMWAIGRTLVNEYSNTANSWTNRHTLSSNATDAINIPLGGLETLVIARETGVTYTSDGSTFFEDSTSIKYLTYWNDLLWGLASTGEFYFTASLAGGWTNVASFFPQSGAITDLFVGPDRDGGEVIYAAAEDGLYVYDNQLERFHKTQLNVPVHPYNGLGCVAWRNSVYFAAGNAIYQYTPGAVNTVAVVGPDLDDGLPNRYQGIIQRLITTHNDLIAILGPNAAAVNNGATAFRSTTAGPEGHRPFTVGLNNARGLIAGWNTQGWEIKWLDTVDLRGNGAAVVATVYGQYRLWFSAGGNVFWMELPTGIVNPNRVTTTEFAASGTWETPWFTADVINYDKLALSIHLDSNHPTSSETIALATALNYDDNDSAFTTIATKSTTGDREYFLPTDENEEGVAFRSFKIRTTLTRGGTTTFTPDIKRIALVYRKRVEPLYGFAVQINLRANTQGRSWREQRDDLERLANNNELVRFTYRDERDNEQVFWVQLTGLTFYEEPGNAGSNMAQVILTEIH